MAVVLGVLAVTAAIDLLTKQLAVSVLAEGRRYAVVGFGLCRLHNERGSVSGVGLALAVLMWLVIMSCITVAVALAPAALHPTTAAGIGLSIGGATGNLVDRILRGSVVDFVLVFRSRVCNLADAAIGLGLLVTLASLAAHPPVYG